MKILHGSKTNISRYIYIYRERGKYRKRKNYERSLQKRIRVHEIPDSLLRIYNKQYIIKNRCLPYRVPQRIRLRASRQKKHI